MKVCLFLLIAALCVLSFCPAVQQTLSAPAPTVQPVADELEDSDAFFQRATTRPAPKKNYSREVSALLARMTLEEKVGQMTQLEIGMITKGEGDNIQIDAEKLEKAVVKYGS
ncbi:MAG TPA: hypothetical protein VIJ87_21580, partial [Pyrinomonadaceae bacterium]